MKRILVIEDDEFHLRMLKTVLIKAEYEVFVAKNGQEGCRLYDRESFDLVISDIFMPEKEGLETIADIRENYPHAKIIAISGGSTRSNYYATDILKIALDLGADLVMAKPIDVPLLFKNVEELIES